MIKKTLLICLAFLVDIFIEFWPFALGIQLILTRIPNNINIVNITGNNNKLPDKNHGRRQPGSVNGR